MGQDPFFERLGDRYTYTNVMLANELVVYDIFRVEVDLLYNERGFSRRRAVMTEHVFYFLELPVVLKLYPVRYVYIGTGVGFAFKVGARPVPWYKDMSSKFMGYDNFTSDTMKSFEVNHVLSVGASVPVYRGVTVIAEIRHNYGLTNMNRHRSVSILLPPNDFAERFRTLYFFIGASYRVL